MTHHHRATKREIYILLELACFIFFFFLGEWGIEVYHSRPAPVVKEAQPVVEETFDYSKKPPQFVVFSFDGSKSLRMWQETLAFADKLRAEGKTMAFTYFLSGIYMVTPENASAYKTPGKSDGTSEIGFGDGYEAMQQRIGYMNEAYKKGHEVGSHAVGHLNGLYWSYEQWMQEFKQFDNLLFSTSQNNPGFPTTTLAFDKSEIIGFRAPYLALQAHNLDQALNDSGYKYDASGIANAKVWPKKTKEGVWEFPLAEIYLPLSKRTTISMDYSIYVVHTGARDAVTKGTPEWERLKEDTVEAYMGLFNGNYNGNRAPISIGHHFTQMNDGVYWAAEQEFAEKVCGLPEVRCSTYRDLVKFLEKAPEGQMEKYQKSDFPAEVKTQPFHEGAKDEEGHQ